MNDDEAFRLLARLPVAAPSAASTVRMRAQSHAVLAARKAPPGVRTRGVIARAMDASMVAAMFLYLAGAVGEAFRLYRLMP